MDEKESGQSVDLDYSTCMENIQNQSSSPTTPHEIVEQLTTVKRRLAYIKWVDWELAITRTTRRRIIGQLEELSKIPDDKKYYKTIRAVARRLQLLENQRTKENKPIDKKKLGAFQKIDRSRSKVFFVLRLLEFAGISEKEMSEVIVLTGLGR
jgi:hypothetical protein